MEYMEGLKRSQIVNMFIDEYLSIKESYFAFEKIYRYMHYTSVNIDLYSCYIVSSQLGIVLFS